MPGWPGPSSITSERYLIRQRRPKEEEGCRYKRSSKKAATRTAYADTIYSSLEKMTASAAFTHQVSSRLLGRVLFEAHRHGFRFSSEMNHEKY